MKKAENRKLFINYKSYWNNNLGNIIENYLTKLNQLEENLTEIDRLMREDLNFYQELKDENEYKSFIKLREEDLTKIIIICKNNHNNIVKFADKIRNTSWEWNKKIDEENLQKSCNNYSLTFVVILSLFSHFIRSIINYIIGKTNNKLIDKSGKGKA